MRNGIGLARVVAIGLAGGVLALSGSEARAGFTHTALEICADNTLLASCPSGNPQQTTGTALGGSQQPQFGEALTSSAAITSASAANSFTWEWLASTSASDSTKFIKATGNFEIDLWNTSEMKIKVSLTNLSTFPTDAAIVSVGIDVDTGLDVTKKVSDVTLASATISPGDSIFPLALINTHLPSIAGINVCASEDAKNCSGKAPDGLQIGASDSFTLDILADAGSNFGADNSHLAVTLEELGTKWQGGAPLSFELPGAPTGTTDAPEPATLALFGAGLLGLGWQKRRKAA